MSYKQVDAKTRSPKFSKKIKEDYDVAVAFKTTLPTTNISPTTYKNRESFFSTQTSSKKFSMTARRPGLIEKSIKQAEKTPGVGHYKLENIDAGLRKTTLGFSKGWK